MTLAHQQLNSDYEKLKQEEAEKSTKLQDLMYEPIFMKFSVNFFKTEHSER